MYKKEIGAHIEKRHDFLIRWKAATNALPESNLSIRQTDTDAIIRGKHFLPFLLILIGGVIDPKWTVAELKEKGDAMLKEGKTNKAIKFYTAALSKLSIVLPSLTAQARTNKQRSSGETDPCRIL